MAPIPPRRQKILRRRHRKFHAFPNLFDLRTIRYMSSSRSSFALGLDYGTNAVRALIVRAEDGQEIAVAQSAYAQGERGIFFDAGQPELARQHPLDYLNGAEQATQTALRQAAEADSDFVSSQIIGIGIDATGSTPMPIDDEGTPLAAHPEFQENLSALAWLWKDHTSAAEAAELSEAAAQQKPEYLQKCGGAYSSEWFWAKLLHCARVSPEVVRRAHTWVEIADWIPAVLTGNSAHPVRGICQAGHKGWFHEDWQGYPDPAFLRQFDAQLERIRRSLPNAAHPSDCQAGRLSRHWAERLGLVAGTPVAVGALDAHLGAVGCGIGEGTIVKILGTSTCDIIVSPMSRPLPYIAGLCGVAPHSVLPGHFGLEAGQSAVGDIFNWWIHAIQPNAGANHSVLTQSAAERRPGESGLLALDWNNGNRSILADSQLGGLLVGQSLQTQPDEIYRALIEATAFGARIIMERIENAGVSISEVVACGGIAEKNPLLMQIYADVTGRSMKTSRSSQTCALGAAICGAVVGGFHPNIPAAQRQMTGAKERVFRPSPAAQSVYEELYALYRQIHDAFGRPQHQAELFPVMKRLLEIRRKARNARGEPSPPKRHSR